MFEPGNKLAIGRPKGIPNKRTQLEPKVRDICTRLGFEPIEVLARIACADWEGLGLDSPTEKKVTLKGDIIEQDRISISDRVHAAGKVADFLYPKKKSIEHTGPDGGAIAISLGLAFKEIRDAKPDHEV